MKNARIVLVHNSGVFDDMPGSVYLQKKNSRNICLYRSDLFLGKQFRVNDHLDLFYPQIVCGSDSDGQMLIIEVIALAWDLL